MFGGRHESALWWGLGPLERQLLKLLWRRGSATVRELVDIGEVAGAYTTLMTTLDRLHKKGVLDREPDGRAFRYSPRQTEAEFHATVARTAIRQLLGAESSAPVSFLVDAVSDYDRELLDDLEKAIERKRRELKAHEHGQEQGPERGKEKR
jgi:predicted transcriptional regulator